MSVTGGRDLDRRPARPFAGDAHQPAHALRDQVEAAAIGVGAGAAEAGDRAVDQAGIGRSRSSS